MKKLISLFIVFATFLGVTLGNTVYVNANHPANGNGTSWSSPYTNLQTAVTYAVAGDLVLVTNGVYSPISTGNKAITIQSVEGSSATSIDGGGTTRCATLGTGVVLKGFTVFNGYSTQNGGGAYGGTLTDCVISGNTANNHGGGAYYGSIYDSVVENNVSGNSGGGIYGENLVSNCVIRYNTCSATYNVGYGGGGLSGGVVMDSEIYGNVATNGANTKGGGISSGTAYRCLIYDNLGQEGGGCFATIVYDSTISNNVAYKSGGGFMTTTATGFLTNTLITCNTAATSGGGSYQGTLTGCTISGNTAATSGGGSYNSTLTDCTISGNTADRGGGSAYGTLTGCTISGNTAQRGGGFNASTLFNSVISNNVAVFNGGGGYNGSINSCIVVGNTAPVGSQIRNQDNNFYAYNSTIIGECSFQNTTRDIFNNIFYGANVTFPVTAQVGFNTFSGTLTGGKIVGPNLASTDPQFTDPANNDFTLLPTSPCVNKGANQYVTTVTDLLGSPRIKDWRVDMGAYESQSTRFVTTPNALFPMGTRDIK